MLWTIGRGMQRLGFPYIKIVRMPVFQMSLEGNTDCTRIVGELMILVHGRPDRWVLSDEVLIEVTWMRSFSIRICITAVGL